MRPLLLVVGFVIALTGAAMCWDILATGEGNPIPAVLTLIVGVAIAIPGYRWAAGQDWPRHE